MLSFSFYLINNNNDMQSIYIIISVEIELFESAGNAEHLVGFVGSQA